MKLKHTFSRHWICTVAVMAFLAACHPTANQSTLSGGYASFQAKNYDQALRQVDQYLTQNPTGTNAAQAWYLRGRALENQNSASPSEAADHLQQARSAYIKALSFSPPPRLEGYIRAALANVAFFQDDYTTAIQQWSMAQPQLDTQELQSGALYRMGVSQQRLGRFVEADRTFALVISRYPNQSSAQRAKEHQFARQFFLQVGVYATAAAGDQAAATLHTQNFPALRLRDSQGRTVLRVGPFANYAQARAAQIRLAGLFPGAMIVP